MAISKSTALVITQAIACLMAVTTIGCSQLTSAGEAPASDPSPFARVVMQMYKHQPAGGGNWELFEDVDLFPDGRFHIIRHCLPQDSDSHTQDGIMTAQVLSAFEDMVRNSGEFSEVAGVPTYTFGVDDNMGDRSNVQGLVWHLLGEDADF